VVLINEILFMHLLKPVELVALSTPQAQTF